ncbi:MAG: hypothetical protein KDA84_07045, partial [Planctomycetaceae bacterium]|nr:hypothetical protein [Planctomycetaceae bacterium]
MWCIKCQADVAAEMAPDNRQILCASCGSRIRAVPLLPTEDKTRQARELLERWSKTRWTEEESPSTESRQPVGAPEKSVDRAVQAKPLPKPVFRLDESHPERVTSQTTPAELEQKVSQSQPESIPQPVAAPHSHIVNSPMPEPAQPMMPRMHEPHAHSYPPPHFPNEPIPADDEPVATNSSSKLQA